MTGTGFIYFGQYEGLSPTSLAIMSRTRSPYSHTSIFLPGLETVIEAWHRGVTISPWTENHTPGTKIVIYKIPVLYHQAEKFYNFANDQIGKGYDFRGVFSFVFDPIPQNKNRWFCSELFIAATQAAGLTVLDIEPHLSSPRDVQLIPSKIFYEYRAIPGELSRFDEKIKTIND